MSTTIKGQDGTLLWQADDFGEYSVMKTGAITKIIEEAIANTKIKVESYIADDDQALANVYSRAQADERFVQLASFPEFLEGQVYRLISSGEIVGVDAINLINSRLLELYLSCFGKNLEGVVVQVGFDTRIQNLEDTENFLYSRITKISSDIYLHRDGEIDVSTLVVAKTSDTGSKSDLNPLISDRTTMVSAINSVFSEIDGISSTVQSLSDDVDGIITRVGNLETQNGNDTLNTTSQTLSGAINELNSSIGTNAGNISSLQSGVGNVNSLDNDFTTKEVVAALNQLINLVNTLSGQISDLDSRVTTLEGRI